MFSSKPKVPTDLPEWIKKAREEITTIKENTQQEGESNTNELYSLLNKDRELENLVDTKESSTFFILSEMFFNGPARSMLFIIKTCVDNPTAISIIKKCEYKAGGAVYPMNQCIACNHDSGLLDRGESEQVVSETLVACLNAEVAVMVLWLIWVMVAILQRSWSFLPHKVYVKTNFQYLGKWFYTMVLMVVVPVFAVSYLAAITVQASKKATIQCPGPSGLIDVTAHFERSTSTTDNDYILNIFVNLWLFYPAFKFIMEKCGSSYGFLLKFDDLIAVNNQKKGIMRHLSKIKHCCDYSDYHHQEQELNKELKANAIDMIKKERAEIILYQLIKEGKITDMPNEPTTFVHMVYKWLTTPRIKVEANTTKVESSITNVGPPIINQE
jgi:hypothetical protein